MIDNEQIHVLIVIDRYMRRGGAEGSTSMIADGLRNTFLFTFFVLEVPKDEDLKYLRSCGINIVYGGPGGLRTWLRLRRICREEQPDLLHAVLARSEVVARVAGILTRTPVVVSLVNTAAEPRSIRTIGAKFKTFLYRIQLLSLGRLWTLRFHALTPAVAESARRKLKVRPHKIDIIGRSRDRHTLGSCSFDRRRQSREKLGLADESFVLLTVAREDVQKNLVVVIDALSELSHLNLVYLIAGRAGNLSDQLSVAIQGKGLSGHVRRLGMRDDVPELLCAADIFVFPSLWEGFGGAVLEAMALEVPIIASDIPPLREVLKDGAMFFPPTDSSRLASLIEEIQKNPSLTKPNVRLSKEIFDANYTPAIINEKWAAFYRQSAERATTKRRYRNSHT